MKTSKHGTRKAECAADDISKSFAKMKAYFYRESSILR